MALSKDAQDWLDAQYDGFMMPDAQYLDADEAREYVSEDKTDTGDVGAGWYARLSAPGYLDCTDWIGPYQTKDEALEALYETFGD